MNYAIANRKDVLDYMQNCGVEWVHSSFDRNWRGHGGYSKDASPEGIEARETIGGPESLQKDLCEKVKREVPDYKYGYGVVCVTYQNTPPPFPYVDVRTDGEGDSFVERLRIAR